MSTLKVPITLELFTKENGANIISINDYDVKQNDNNQNNVFEVQLYLRSKQFYNANNSTNDPNYYFYDLTNIKAGGWIGGMIGGFAWRVLSIVGLNLEIDDQDSSIVLRIEDIDNYNYFTDPFSFNGAPISYTDYIYFELNENGLPEFFNLLNTESQNIPIGLFGRFTYRNIRNKYIQVKQEGHGFKQGQSIYISGADSNNQPIYSLSDETNIVNAIGIVTSVGIPNAIFDQNDNTYDAGLPNNNYFSFKPLGEYFEDVQKTFSTLNFSSYRAGTILYYLTGTQDTNIYTVIPPLVNPIKVWTYLGLDLVSNTQRAILHTSSTGSSSGGQDPSGLISVGTTGTTGLSNNITYSNINEVNFNSNDGFSITPNPQNASSVLISFSLLTNPPPQIVFEDAPSPTSKYIYIPWKYPNQISGGSLDMYLPLITSFTCKWSANISNTLSSNNSILTADTSSNCIKYSGHTLRTNYITGLVLTNNSNVTTGFTSLNFPLPINQTRYCYVYYNSNFANLTTSTDNKITAYYENFAGYYPAYFTIGTFGLVSPPIAPNGPPTVTITTSTSTTFNNEVYISSTISGKVTSAAIGFNEIVSNDPNNSDGYSVLKYRATLTSTASSKRYTGSLYNGSLISYTSLTDSKTSESSTSLIDVTNLFPDSTYTVTTAANNNSSNSAFGPESSSNTFTTLGIPPSLTSFNGISFSLSSTITAKLVGTTEIKTVINASNISNITSPIITSPIHNYTTRGSSTNNNLLSISCSVTRNGVTIASSSSSSLNYKGFGQSLPSAVTGSISLTPNTVEDAYTTNYLQGYYLNAKFSVSLNSSFNGSETSIFDSSPYQTTCTLTQAQNDISGSQLTQQIGNTSTVTSFYRDSFSTISSIGTFNITLDTNTTYKQISGIYIANNVYLVATTEALNLGRYFYNKATLLSYNFVLSNSSIGGTTSVTTMPNGYYSNNNGINTINSSISFTTTNITYSSDVYATSCQIKVTPWAWNSSTANGTPGTSNILSVIFDPLSITLINNTSFYPSSIQLGNGTAGFRVWAGKANSNGVNSLPTQTFSSSTSNVSYTDNTYKYNHSWNISESPYNEELQIHNGLYCTKGVSGSYANYSGYEKPSGSSQPNYSTISGTGKRYANFVWNCGNVAAEYSKVMFQIFGFTKNVAKINEEADSIDLDDNHTMRLFFRIENTNNIASFTTVSNNTTWINATAINSQSTNNNINTSIVIGGKNNGLTNTSTVSGTNYTLTIYSTTPSITLVSTDLGKIYLYARVELSMGANVGFKYITATLS